MAIALINADRALSTFVSTAWFPTVGKEGVLYFAQDTEITYRWDVNSGAYVQFASATGSGGVTDHGLLTGLADDDHPQYALDTDLAAHMGDTTDAHPASAITNTPAGSIAATTVQAAINELDTEKQPLNATLTTIADATLGAFSHRNKIINPLMAVDQRNAGAAQTITAAAALAYTVDRWYAYCTGANVTGQRVAGTAPNKYNYQFTGAASVTKIGFAQRIEAANCQDLAGKTATLAVDLANSLLTTVTWTAWYANTEDTFGSLATPTRTQIATGTFTVSGTLARYNAQIAIPAAATTGIEIEFSVGAQTSGTWTIGRVQLEQGSVATPFEYRPIGTELALCQRYNTVIAVADLGYSTATVNAGGVTFFPVPMRATPTLSANAVGNSNAGTTTTDTVSATDFRYYAGVTAAGAYQINYSGTATSEL